MKKLFLLPFFILAACSFTPTVGQDLIGKDEKYIQKKFGQPIVSRTEAPNRIYSYRFNDCSLLIYFDQTDTVQYIDYSGNCH